MTLLLSTAHLLEVVELRIPIRVLGAFGGLAVRLQGVAELVQQDHTMTHRVPQRLQLGGELAQPGQARPQTIDEQCATSAATEHIDNA